MLEILNNLDTTIFLAANGAHSPFFDNFMELFSDRFVWIPMYATVVGIIFSRRRPAAALMLLLALAAAIFITDQTCATVIRPMVERMRPSNPSNPLSTMVYIVNDYRGGPFGFPSCHAANSFALAAFVSLTAKRRAFTIFIFGWAMVNSCSRLYLGVHYPGDLLVGAIVGIVVAIALYRIAVFAIGRWPRVCGDLRSATESDDSPITLRQLTPGMPLLSLSLPDATMLTLPAARTGILDRVHSYQVTIAAGLLTLLAITVASTL